MIQASPKKLRTGDWGALVQGTDAVKQGDLVEIKTKAGKTWTTRVSKVVWTGNGVTICKTDSGKGKGGSRKRSCKYCGCTEPNCGATGVCKGPDFDPCFDCV